MHEDVRSDPGTQGRRSRLFRYAVAAACSAGALVISLQTVPVLHSSTVFLAAVVIASWFGGPGPGLFSAVLATWAVEYFFTQPLHSFTPTLHQVPRLAVFAILAVLGGWASASRRRAEVSLQQARHDLELRVQERTAQLQLSNERLHSEIGERRLAEQAVEQLAGRLIHAQEEERSRIGRELHDHISQMLGVVTIRIDQLRAAGAPGTELDRALADLRRNVTELTEDVHRLSHRLHSSTLDYLGLVPALQKLIAEFSDGHDIRVAFEHDGLPSPLSSEVALCLFRVVEESLTNIAKHSGALAARIRLHGGLDGLHLSVEDSGVGFHPGSLERRAGLGFVSMQERLRVFKGTIRVDSAPSRGTKIEAWVPSASLQPVADPGGTTGAAGRATPGNREERSRPIPAPEAAGR
jgi:signal transduction histidine kinase